MTLAHQIQPKEDFADSADEAIILAADHSLSRKCGGGVLDRVLSLDAIKKAEAFIASSANGLYLDCVGEAAKLQMLASHLTSGGADAEQYLTKIIASSFAIKAKAAQSGYDLVSTLAKSLLLRCEEITAKQITPTTLKIIVWHAESIRRILELNIKGLGGEAGKALLIEIDRLKLAA